MELTKNPTKLRIARLNLFHMWLASSNRQRVPQALTRLHQHD